MKIDWELPQFRKGFYGQIDKLIGPGATKAEKNLQLYLPLLGIAIVVLHGLYMNFNWSIGQYVVAAILIGDMVGGVVTNATSTAKRWNFREGNDFKAHMSFVGLHIIQVFLVSYFFLNFDLLWIGLIYGYLMITCAFILAMPLYLQRPVAMTVCAVSLVLSIYVFKSPEHLEWIMPLFFLKLQVCHVLREEPYRPDVEDEH